MGQSRPLFSFFAVFFKRTCLITTNRSFKKNEGLIKSTQVIDVISGQSYKASTIVNYDSRVVIWGIFKSGTTLES